MGTCLARIFPHAHVKYVPAICGHQVFKFAFHVHLFQQLKSIETSVGNEFEKSKYHSPKRLDKINGQIFVKTFNITCLSTIQPGFISPSFRHLNKIYLQLEQLIWPVDTEIFAPWKWFRLPRVWAAVVGCLTPQTEHIESLEQLSPRCFRQMQKLQCPFFKATSEQLQRFNFLLLCYLSNYCRFSIPRKNRNNRKC